MWKAIFLIAIITLAVTTVFSAISFVETNSLNISEFLTPLAEYIFENNHSYSTNRQWNQVNLIHSENGHRLQVNLSPVDKACGFNQANEDVCQCLEMLIQKAKESRVILEYTKESPGAKQSSLEDQAKKDENEFYVAFSDVKRNNSYSLTKEMFEKESDQDYEECFAKHKVRIGQKYVE